MSESESDVPPIVVVNKTSGDQFEEVVDDTGDSSATHRLTLLDHANKLQYLGSEQGEHGLDIDIICSFL